MGDGSCVVSGLKSDEYGKSWGCEGSEGNEDFWFRHEGLRRILCARNRVMGNFGVLEMTE